MVSLILRHCYKRPRAYLAFPIQSTLFASHPVCVNLTLSYPLSPCYRTVSSSSFIFSSTSSSSASSSSSSSTVKAEPINVVRGMHDIMDDELRVRKHIEYIFYQVVSRRGYVPIETPIVETIHLYERSLGNDSDVLMKEMYTLQSTQRIKNTTTTVTPSLTSSSSSSVTTDTSGTLALRPEGTAGVMRAIMNANKLRTSKTFPLRYAYCGSMFRHERPQKGRYRQFAQLGIETINSSNPQMDIESISQAYQFLQTILPLTSSSSSSTISSPPFPTYRLKLLINTLGDSMDNYVTVLTTYFESYRSQLSSDSQYRLTRSAVLRILDSKHTVDQSIIQNAPRLYDYLSNEAKERFQTVLQGLDALNIPYVIDYRLVRGLDYYCHTVFEFIVEEYTRRSISEAAITKTEGTGQLGTVLAGGRYDKLSQLLGYKDAVPCIGWAAGMERLSILSSPYILNACSSVIPKRTTIAILPVTDTAPPPSLSSSLTKSNALLAKYCQEVAKYCEQIHLYFSPSPSLSVSSSPVGTKSPATIPPSDTDTGKALINPTLLTLLSSSIQASYTNPSYVTTYLYEPHSKLKTLLSQASHQHIDIVIIIGSNELLSRTLVVKHLRTGQQVTVPCKEDLPNLVKEWSDSDVSST